MGAVHRANHWRDVSRFFVDDEFTGGGPISDAEIRYSTRSVIAGYLDGRAVSAPAFLLARNLKVLPARSIRFECER
jgi:hypothetical protein